MKYIIIAILILISTLVGYLFSKKYKSRANFFQSLVFLCQKFDVEINYSRERLKNIFNGLEDKHKKNLSGLDKNFISYLDKETSLEKEELFKNITILKDNEKDVIFSFFRCLGRSDVDSQSKEIKNYQVRFEELSSLTTKDNKKYGSLSIKLGVIAGLLIAVIII